MVSPFSMKVVSLSVHSVVRSGLRDILSIIIGIIDDAIGSWATKHDSWDPTCETEGFLPCVSFGPFFQWGQKSSSKRKHHFLNGGNDFQEISQSPTKPENPIVVVNCEFGSCDSLLGKICKRNIRLGNIVMCTL